jgi:hypothetical protein
MRKLRAGDVLAGLGGLALLVVMFFPWFEFVEGVSVGTRNVTDAEQSAWEAFALLDVVLAITAVLAVALLVTTALERSPAVPVALQVFGGTIGAITLLWALIRLLNPPGPNVLADRQWGVWVGVACLAAAVVGMWWSMRDEQRP